MSSKTEKVSIYIYIIIYLFLLNNNIEHDFRGFLKGSRWWNPTLRVWASLQMGRRLVRDWAGEQAVEVEDAQQLAVYYALHLDNCMNINHTLSHEVALGKPVINKLHIPCLGATGARCEQDKSVQLLYWNEPMKNLTVTEPTATMTSLELREIVNAARAERGESKVRNDQFLARIEDELEGDLSGCKTFAPAQGGTPMKYYDLTREQCTLVGMRESKAVRRAVLAKLKEVEEQAQLHLNKPDPALYLEQAGLLLRREADKLKQQALAKMDTDLYTFRSVAKLINQSGQCSRALNDSGIRSMAVNAGWLTPCHTRVKNKGEYFLRWDVARITGRKSASHTLKLTFIGKEVLVSEYNYPEPLDAEKQLRWYLSRFPTVTDKVFGLERKEVIDHLILEWKQAERGQLPFSPEPLQRLAGHLSGTQVLLN